MLVASGTANISGKSVTTLIVSIVVLDREEAVPPPFHHHPGRDTFESHQPLPGQGPPPRRRERCSAVRLRQYGCPFRPTRRSLIFVAKLLLTSVSKNPLGQGRKHKPSKILSELPETKWGG